MEKINSEIDISEEDLFITNYKFLNLNSSDENKEEIEDLNNSEKIPTFIKILFSLPAFGKMSCLLIMNIHALILYESIGSSLLLISFFTALARSIEIILKPFIAHLSDNCRLKIGRRKPFMLIGSIIYSISIVLLFSPPKIAFTPLQISIWFGVLYVIFFIADTICNIPYQSLGPELSSDSKQRESLYLVFYICQYLGVLFASLGPVFISKIIRDCNCDYCNESLAELKMICLNECKIKCTTESNDDSYLYMVVFIAMFFVITIFILCSEYKEKKLNTNKAEKSHLIPTLFRMMNNKPFITLLIPWIIDVTVSSIFATMLPFFINYVINPQKYCIDNQIELNSDICSSTNWLGLTISIFIIFCIFSTLFWHYLISYIGKKKVWQLYSIIFILTFSLFLVCDEGSMFLLVLFAIFCSLPAGGCYLNDVLLSDIIDYDEFITGKRNEGIYIVFSSFTPKIVGIFAQSLPLTIMTLLDFVPTQEGKIMKQPQAVIEFIRFYFIGIPVLLSLISFYFKLNYPIDNDRKMQELKNAINVQKYKIPEMKDNYDFYKIRNPIFGYDQINIFCKESQLDTKTVIDHFDSIEYLNYLYKEEYKMIKEKIIYILIYQVIAFSFFLILLIVTFKYLEYKSLNMIPLISLIILTIILLFLIINFARLNIINKVIEGKYVLDLRFIKLNIHKMQIMMKLEEDTNTLSHECDQMIDDCRTKKE